MNARLPGAAHSGPIPTNTVRLQARAAVNAEDASVWRWLSLLMQDSRIRWVRAHEGWLVSIDHRHMATEASFDEAIRAAKGRFDEMSNAPQRLAGHAAQRFKGAER